MHAGGPRRGGPSDQGLGHAPAGQLGGIPRWAVAGSSAGRDDPGLLSAPFNYTANLVARA